MKKLREAIERANEVRQGFRKVVPTAGRKLDKNIIKKAEKIIAGLSLKDSDSVEVIEDPQMPGLVRVIAAFAGDRNKIKAAMEKAGYEREGRDFDIFGIKGTYFNPPK